MKITDIEIKQNNVKSAPDKLSESDGASAESIKNIFDKLPELIAQKHNALVDYVNEEVYTKTEVDQTMEDKLVNVGAGDMSRAVYDADNDGIVDRAKIAETLDGGLTGEKVILNNGRNVENSLNGIWLDFKDANGNATDEMYGHWYEDGNGNVIGSGDTEEGGSFVFEPLTFTGAVSATYDGSKAVTVNIPAGGGGASDCGNDVPIVFDINEDASAAVCNKTYEESMNDYNNMKLTAYVRQSDGIYFLLQQIGHVYYGEDNQYLSFYTVVNGIRLGVEYRQNGTINIIVESVA